MVCGEALKAVVACTKSALTFRPLPFPFLPVCVASSCASPEVQARALFFAQRRSAALQGASWWSKKAFEGVPAELRQLLDALLRGADHGSGHTGQRHGCRRDRVVAYGQRQCVHRVLLLSGLGRLTDFLNRTIYTTPRIPPCRGAHGESGAHMPRTQRRRVRVKYVAKRHIFFSAQPTHRHAIAARGIAGQHVGGRG